MLCPRASMHQAHCRLLSSPTLHYRWHCPVQVLPYLWHGGAKDIDIFPTWHWLPGQRVIPGCALARWYCRHRSRVRHTICWPQQPHNIQLVTTLQHVHMVAHKSSLQLHIAAICISYSSLACCPDLLACACLLLGVTQVRPHGTHTGSHTTTTVRARQLAQASQYCTHIAPQRLLRHSSWEAHLYDPTRHATTIALYALLQLQHSLPPAGTCPHHAHFNAQYTSHVR